MIPGIVKDTAYSTLWSKLEEAGIAGNVTAADPGIAVEKDTEYIVSWTRK